MQTLKYVISSEIGQFPWSTLGGAQSHLVIPATVANLRGEFITELHVDASRTPALTLLGLAKTTMAAHRRCIKQLSELIKEFALHHAPLPTAVIESLTRHSKRKKWKSSTLLTKLAQVQGALVALPLYTRETLSVRLCESPLWTQAMRGARKLSHEEEASHPKPATTEAITQAVQLAQDPKVKIALIVMWLTAARPGCTRALVRRNIRLTDTGHLSVQFRKGKTVVVRGPYTVHTHVPEPWREFVINHLSSLQPHELVADATPQAILSHLRSIDSKLELRSMRRGALLALSAAGVPEDQLLLWSGHTNVTTLRRYLGWDVSLATSSSMHQKATLAFSRSG